MQAETYRKMKQITKEYWEGRYIYMCQQSFLHNTIWDQVIPCYRCLKTPIACSMYKFLFSPGVLRLQKICA
jgi:hypothetical protein